MFALQKTAAGGLAVLCLLASAPARSAPLFTFETDASDAATPYSSTSSGVTASFAGSSFADPDAFAISFNSTSGPLPLYAKLNGAFLGTSPFSLDPSSPLRITFSQKVQVVSLNFALGDRSGALSLATDTGGTSTTAGSVTPGYRYAEGTLTYSGASFTTITLLTTATSLAIDNIALTLAAATPIPEPAPLTLVAVALAVVGLTRRSERSL